MLSYYITLLYIQAISCHICVFVNCMYHNFRLCTSPHLVFKMVLTCGKEVGLRLGTQVPALSVILSLKSSHHLVSKLVFTYGREQGIWLGSDLMEFNSTLAWNVLMEIIVHMHSIFCDVISSCNLVVSKYWAIWEPCSPRCQSS